MSLFQARVPALLGTSIVCLALGGALGVGAMMGLGYRVDFPILPPSDRAISKRAEFERIMAEDRARAQRAAGNDAVSALVALVARLDQLQRRPLSVELDAKQRVELSMHLEGLGDLKVLTEDDARKRLDAILPVLDEQRSTLEQAGFRWPAEDRGPGVAVNGNPFRDEANRKHLEALLPKKAES